MAAGGQVVAGNGVSRRTIRAPTARAGGNVCRRRTRRSTGDNRQEDGTYTLIVLRRAGIGR